VVDAKEDTNKNNNVDVL